MGLNDTFSAVKLKQEEEGVVKSVVLLLQMTPFNLHEIILFVAGFFLNG